MKILALLPDLPPEQERGIAVEYPCSDEFARHRGYSRFVEFRDPVEWLGMDCRYALVEQGPSKFTSTAQANPECQECKRKGAIEFGRCAICGAPRGPVKEPERVAIHD